MKYYIKGNFMYSPPDSNEQQFGNPTNVGQDLDLDDSSTVDKAKDAISGIGSVLKKKLAENSNINYNYRCRIFCA